MKDRDRADLIRTLLEVMPIPVFITDDDVSLRFFNRAAGRLLGSDHCEAEERPVRLGEALACRNSIEKGCGMSGFCGDCVIRNSTYEAIGADGARRRKTRMKCSDGDGGLRIVDFLVTTAPVDFKGERLAMVILEDISELIQLKRLIPICSKCKKIRTDKGYWQSVERVLRDHVDVEFSHSFCKECAKELYGDDKAEDGKERDGNGSV
jgi:hypothetical protein